MTPLRCHSATLAAAISMTSACSRRLSARSLFVGLLLVMPILILYKGSRRPPNLVQRNEKSGKKGYGSYRLPVASVACARDFGGRQDSQMARPGYATQQDLLHWADSQPGRSEFPRLIRRLVLETTPDLLEITF